MPKFEVEYRQIEVYRIEVEAEDEDGAFEKVDDIMETEDKYRYHEDSDTEVKAYEID